MISAERDAIRETMTVQIEHVGLPWGSAAPGYVVGVYDGSSAHGARGRVLAPLDALPELDAAKAIDLPADLPADTALLVPLLGEALRAWDLLSLEMGTAAVVTQGLPWSPLFALVARWYGAVPLVVGSAGEGDQAGAIVASDVDAVARFAKTLSEFPAVAAIELSGRADTVDLLLEAVPRYARVLFAGPRHDRLTIDYYVNVHRKGMHLASTVLSSMRMFSGGEANAHLVRRACRLLANRARAAACKEAVDRAAVGIPVR